MIMREIDNWKDRNDFEMRVGHSLATPESTARRCRDHRNGVW